MQKYNAMMQDQTCITVKAWIIQTAGNVSRSVPCSCLTGHAFITPPNMLKDVTPDLIRNPEYSWIPACAGMTTIVAKVVIVIDAKAKMWFLKCQ
jgi:hypothetical protein